MDKLPITDYKALGAKLKAKRLERGLTQGQAAEKLVLSESFYSRIENGSRMLSVDSLVRISNFYGVSIDWLLSDSTHSANYTELSAEVDNIFRGKSPAQTALLLNLLKLQAGGIDKLTP